MEIKRSMLIIPIKSFSFFFLFFNANNDWDIFTRIKAIKEWKPIRSISINTFHANFNFKREFYQIIFIYEQTLNLEYVIIRAYNYVSDYESCLRNWSIARLDVRVLNQLVDLNRSYTISRF